MGWIGNINIGVISGLFGQVIDMRGRGGVVMVMRSRGYSPAVGRAPVASWLL